MTEYFSCHKLNIKPFQEEKNSQQLLNCQTVNVMNVLGYSNINVYWIQNETK